MVQKALLALMASIMMTSSALAAKHAGPKGHRVMAEVKISEQQIRIYIDDVLRYGPWPVSTANEKYVCKTPDGFAPCKTPTGTFRPQGTELMHPSSEYVGAVMPYTVWIRRATGHAIHAATPDEVGDLGHMASHGCVRLGMDHARTFFDLVINPDFRGRVTIRIVP